MAISNPKLQQALRLEEKTLEAKFINEIQHGLNCSPFESEAVLEVVREVFYPYLGQGDKPMPGCVSLVVVAADEPAGKPLSDCEKTVICLRVHRGAKDDKLLQEHGPEGFRRARIAELCQEALSLGGVLTREDLAYRIFFVSPRTISRDLAFIHKADPKSLVAIRSIRHDIGPVLTHRAQIVSLALQGKTTTQICRIMRHSPEAVSNYISTFVRCVQLARRGLEPAQIAFLVRRGKSLVSKYLELAGQSENDKNQAYHLSRMLELGQVQLEKKQPIKRGWK